MPSTNEQIRFHINLLAALHCLKLLNAYPGTRHGSHTLNSQPVGGMMRQSSQTDPRAQNPFSPHSYPCLYSTFFPIRLAVPKPGNQISCGRAQYLHLLTNNLFPIDHSNCLIEK